MKTQHFFILTTLLLTQTMPVKAMMTPEEFEFDPAVGPGPARHQFKFVKYIEPDQASPEPKALFQPLPAGQPVECVLRNPQHVGYEARFFEGVELNPVKPLSQHIGQAWEKFSCTFEYAKHDYKAMILCPRPYPLQGAWEIKVNQNPGGNKPPRDECHLRLTTNQAPPSQSNPMMQPVKMTQNPSSPVEHNMDPVTIDHARLRTDNPLFGKYVYDGQTVFQEKRTLIQWKSLDPMVGPYDKSLYETNSLPQDHKGNTIIYVEAFPLNGQVPRPSYKGKYTSLGHLRDHEKKPCSRMIYSDGKNLFFPKITQERWVNDDDDGHEVGFLVASFNRYMGLSLIPSQCVFSSNRFGEGLYSLAYREDKFERSLEKWEKVGAMPPHEVEIYVASPVPSIPGFWTTPRNIVPQKPNITYDEIGRIVSIKGVDVGVDDLIEALNSHRIIKEMKVFGLHAITLNKSFEKPGLSCCMIAPTITVGSPIVINFSGTGPGYRGSGGDGGVLLMVTSNINQQELSQLTVNTNGGPGAQVDAEGPLKLKGIRGDGGFGGFFKLNYIAEPSKSQTLKGASGDGGRKYPGRKAPNDTDLINEYKNYYFESAIDPALSSYMGVFPNLK